MVITLALSAFDTTPDVELEDIETLVIKITPTNVDLLDQIVDSQISNLKLRVLTYIRTNYPHVWHKDSPTDLDALTKLQLDEQS